VVHSGIADVHATGHAKADELKTFLSIAKPEWFVPVHGEYRHMVQPRPDRNADGHVERTTCWSARTATG
jgi:mRNA degradation ribonuclease J1/J2